MYKTYVSNISINNTSRLKNIKPVHFGKLPSKCALFPHTSDLDPVSWYPSKHENVMTSL